jgi:hypothetical protein
MWLDAIEATGGWLSDGRTPCVYIFSRAVMDCTALPCKTRSSSPWPRRQLSSIFMFWRLVDSRELNRLPGDLIAVAAVRHTLDPDQYETPQPTLTFSLSIVRTGRVELCQVGHWCPKCHGQRTVACPVCGGSGGRAFAGVVSGICEQCHGAARCRCDVCGGAAEVEPETLQRLTTEQHLH